MMPHHWFRQARNYLEFQTNLGFTELLIPTSGQTEPKQAPLDEIRTELGDCTRCALHRSRTNIVFGEGDPDARLLLIGEGPGAEEDSQGKPFVGRAGQLLNRMIKAMGLERSEVYIANVVKCRPPENRDPEPVEIRTCLPFLEAQIGAVGPEVIITLGRIATGTMLETGSPVSRLRGRFHDYKGIPVMPTYHPSYLLRTEKDRQYKKEAWSDLQQVMAFLGLLVPGSGEKL
jgi:uracil-DNA glycosylase